MQIIAGMLVGAENSTGIAWFAGFLVGLTLLAVGWTFSARPRAEVDKADVQTARKIFGEEVSAAALGLAFVAFCAMVSFAGTGYLLERHMPHDLSLAGYVAVRVFIALLGTAVVLNAFMVIYLAVAKRPNPQKNGTAG